MVLSGYVKVVYTVRKNMIFECLPNFRRTIFLHLFKEKCVLSCNAIVCIKMAKGRKDVYKQEVIVFTLGVYGYAYIFFFVIVVASCNAVKC